MKWSVAVFYLFIYLFIYLFFVISLESFFFFSLFYAIIQIVLFTLSPITGQEDLMITKLNGNGIFI